MYLQILFGSTWGCLPCDRPLTFDLIYFYSCELSKAVCDTPSLVEVPCSQSQSTQPPLPTTTTPARTTTHAGPIPIIGWRHNPIKTTYSCNKVKPKWTDCKKYITKLFVLNCLCVYFMRKWLLNSRQVCTWQVDPFNV